MNLLAAARSHVVLVDANGRAQDLAATRSAVRAIAERLVTPDVIVACSDRVAFVHAVLAVWSTGRRVVLPPNLLPASISSLVDGDTMVIDDDGPHAAVASTASAHGFVRLFTSGTTGAPKAIDKSEAQLVGEARVLASTFGLLGRRVLCTVPFGHVYGLLFGVLVPLVADGTIVGAAPLHAESVRTAIETHRVDVLCTTPAQLRSFAVLDAGALPPALAIFSSGATLPDGTAAMLRERHRLAVIEVLGSTETGGIATRTHDRTAPLWQALPSVDIDTDPDGRMLVRSPWALGTDVVARTEDRIEWMGDGFVHRGRVDDVVKVAGRRVATGDIVARVRELAGVDDVAAVPLHVGDGRGTAIGLAVATTRTPDEIRDHLARAFEASVVPRAIACVATLGRDATGKLPRSRVLALLGRDDDHQARVVIDPALPCFVGHFPGDPIYPGAMLLDAVVFPAVREAWPGLAHPSGILRAKFSEPIRPGDALEVGLVRKDDVVTFDVRRGGVSCASGRLRYGAPTPALGLREPAPATGVK